MKFTREAYNWIILQINSMLLPVQIFSLLLSLYAFRVSGWLVTNQPEIGRVALPWDPSFFFLFPFCDLELGNLSISSDEIEFLKTNCPYLNQSYLRFLGTFRLNPSEQLDVTFQPVNNGADSGADSELGDVQISIHGLWVDTILYEIPLLAIVSEAYFKWCDRDWDYRQQEEKAFRKACALLEHGCIFSEFGTRRRRDYHTQDLVMQGLCRAARIARDENQEMKGVLSGTSNVHFAMKYGLQPVGTVAHEWYMGIAAITNDYEHANELASRYWLGCFGEGVRFFPSSFFTLLLSFIFLWCNGRWQY